MTKEEREEYENSLRNSPTLETHFYWPVDWMDLSIQHDIERARQLGFTRCTFEIGEFNKVKVLRYDRATESSLDRL